jgi:hypothetical protein
VERIENDAAIFLVAASFEPGYGPRDIEDSHFVSGFLEGVVRRFVASVMPVVGDAIHHGWLELATA